jgi:hypothetical protein
MGPPCTQHLISTRTHFASKLVAEAIRVRDPGHAYGVWASMVDTTAAAGMRIG